jgi:hypothetical protein
MHLDLSTETSNEGVLEGIGLGRCQGNTLKGSHAINREAGGDGRCQRLVVRVAGMVAGERTGKGRGSVEVIVASSSSHKHLQPDSEMKQRCAVAVRSMP